VVLNAVIKSLGIHNVALQLHPEVSVAVTVNVARSMEEAETQAKTGRMVSAEDLEAEEDDEMEEEEAAAEEGGAKADEGASAASEEESQA